MAQQREKFATQVSTDVLNSLRGLAETEGRQLQSLVDEALTDVLAAQNHPSLLTCIHRVVSRTQR
jgi:hypothetical protein